jgi:hypothetical protein
MTVTLGGLQQQLSRRPGYSPPRLDPVAPELPLRGYFFSIRLSALAYPPGLVAQATLSIPGVMMLRTLAYKFLGMFSPNPKRSFLHTLLLCAVVVCTTVLCAVVLYGAGRASRAAMTARRFPPPWEI